MSSHEQLANLYLLKRSLDAYLRLGEENDVSGASRSETAEAAGLGRDFRIRN